MNNIKDSKQYNEIQLKRITPPLVGDLFSLKLSPFIDIQSFYMNATHPKPHLKWRSDSDDIRLYVVHLMASTIICNLLKPNQVVV